MSRAGPGRRPMVAGNWKMHLDHFAAIALTQRVAYTLRPQETDVVEVVVLPPFTDLRSVQTLVDADNLDLGYGAQDVSPHEEGAHTGDVSAAMLARLGCRYVVVGHSERRAEHHEDDAVVAAKAAAAFRHGLVPILCVGESLEVREAGHQVELVTGQLAAATADLGPEQVAALVVAYEPVWAIGTGQVAGPEDAQQMAAALRGLLAGRWPASAAATRILYGGSVKSTNAADLLAGSDVDGALVGGASLHAEEFAAIVRSVPALAR